MLTLLITAYRLLPGPARITCPRSPSCSLRGLAAARQGICAVLAVIAECSDCGGEHPYR